MMQSEVDRLGFIVNIKKTSALGTIEYKHCAKKTRTNMSGELKKARLKLTNF